jgi:hypothetical protein
MSEETYERLITASIVAGIAAVVLYDRVPAFRGVSLAVAAIAGLVAVGSYLSFKLRETRSGVVRATDLNPDAAKLAMWTNPALNSEPEEERKTREYVRRILLSSRRAILHQEGILTHNAVRMVLAHPGRIEVAHFRDTQPALQPLDPKAMVEMFVRIAQDLNSAKHEVILTPQGQILVRPCFSVSRHQDPAQPPFTELTPGTARYPN